MAERQAAAAGRPDRQAGRTTTDWDRATLASCLRCNLLLFLRRHHRPHSLSPLFSNFSAFAFLSSAFVEMVPGRRAAGLSGLAGGRFPASDWLRVSTNGMGTARGVSTTECRAGGEAGRQGEGRKLRGNGTMVGRWLERAAGLEKGTSNSDDLSLCHFGFRISSPRSRV